MRTLRFKSFAKKAYHNRTSDFDEQINDFLEGDIEYLINVEDLKIVVRDETEYVYIWYTRSFIED